MSGIATAVVGSAVIGAVTSSRAAGKAADAAKDSNAATVAEQRRQYDQTRADFAPYREVGRGALSSLADIYGLDRPSNTIDNPDAAEVAGYGRIERPGKNPYWSGTDAQWDDYVRNLLVDPNYVAHGPRGINDYLRKYVNDSLTRQQLFGGVTDGGYYTNNGTTSDRGERRDTQPTPGPGQQGFPSSEMSGEFIDAGGKGSSQPSGVDRYAGFMASPGYQFRLDEGNKAIQRSAAARGSLFSGATLKGLTNYSQGVASDEWGNYVRGLQSLAGVGQTSTGSTAAAGANAANNIGASNTNAANLRGSAYLAGGEGINNAIQGGIGNYLTYQYLKK